MCQAHAALENVDPVVLQTLLARREVFTRFLVRRLHDPVVAEEVLQESFLKGLDKLCHLRDPEAAVAWFYRVLRNAVNDRYRAWEAERRRATEVEADTLEADEAEAEGRPCGCVHGAVDALKPEYAEVIREVELGGVPLKAWAARRGLTANNAGVRAFRARAALLREVQHTCGSCAEGHCRDCTCAA